MLDCCLQACVGGRLVFAPLVDHLVEIATELAYLQLICRHCTCREHVRALHSRGCRPVADPERALEFGNRLMSRHPGLVLSTIEQRLPSRQPTFAEGRNRLTDSLRELGLR